MTFPIGDPLDLGNDVANAVFGSAPPQFAPVPEAGGPPPGPVQRASWTAPSASGGGQITVDRSVLRSVAQGMHSDVADLDDAATRVQNAGSALGSFSGWSTGSAFGGNMSSACVGFSQVGTHTSDTLNGAAKNLTDSAATYDDTEAQNTQSIRRSAGSTISASGSSVSSMANLLGW